jgi:hypothetical protein
VGLISWVWGFILRFIPLEKILPGGGKQEVTTEDLNRISSISVRRSHNANFYKKHSVFEKKASVIEDKSLRLPRAG